ncbi:MAG: peptide MFS transporter [Gammaproteobacteria bacterium]|nr:peptide MFS transporter [Gammaproteobacteria bacterium]
MKQPAVLRYFFLTELWERFGFYTVQTLLVLYMVSALNFSDDRAYTIIGSFTALAYITPLLGGYLADRIIGYRLSIILGGLLLCAGYACLGLFPHQLLGGLTLVVLGNGLFKPNISSFLGQFYEKDDPRRDSGFTLFYIGINIGGLLAPVLGGFIQKWFGWYTCFGVASLGLLIGVLTFRASFPLLQDKGASPRHPQLTKLHQLIFAKPQLLFLLALSMAVIFALFNFPDITINLLKIVGVLLLIGLVVITLKQTSVERKHMTALIVMLLFSVVFWGLFFEVYFSVNLFTDRAVDHVIFGFTIPTAAFVGLESTFIILLGPLFAIVWQRTNPRMRFMTTPYKFAYGLLFVALAFELLAVVVNHSAIGVAIHPAWLVAFYILFVFAELFLSPIGLSMITSLTPAKYVGLMMGVWFLTLGYGGALSGILAQDASILETTESLAVQMHIYKNAFQHFANLGFVAFAVLFLAAPLLTKLMFSTSGTK